MFDNAPLLELPGLPDLPPEPPLLPPEPPLLPPEPPEPPHRPERPKRPEPFRLDKAAYDLIDLPLGTAYRALSNNLISREGLLERDFEYEDEPLVIALGHLQRVFRWLDLALIEADRIDVSGPVDQHIDEMADDPTCTAAELGGLVFHSDFWGGWRPTDQTDYVSHELYKKIRNGCEILIYQMADADRDLRSGHLVRAIGYIRLADQALSRDRCDRHHIAPAHNPRAFAELIAEADVEVCCRAAATLGDQLIQQAEQQKEARCAGGQGQRPDSEEPT